jgi:hypothetical protein
MVWWILYLSGHLKFNLRVFSFADLIQKMIALDTYKIFFICELIGGEKTASIEASEIDFFEKNDLPDLFLRRIIKSQIERAFAHKQDMAIPTDLD